MTAAERFEHRLETGLDDLADARFPDYFDDVLAATHRTRQRPAWTFPGRWLPMVDIARRPAYVPSLPWRMVTLAMVLLLLAALALLFAGSRPRLPAPFGLARNGLIPFDTNGDIYLGDPVAGTSRLILSGPETDNDPAYSRSGTMIAFVRIEPGNDRSTIWSMHPDGSHLTKLTPVPLIGQNFWDWGGDENTILYSSKEGGVPRLHVVAADGSSPPRVLVDDLGVWSFSLRPPDGQELVVRGTDKGRAGVYVVDVRTGAHRTLVAPDATPYEDHDYGDPRVSPDGTKVAYQHWDPAFANMQLHVIDFDGSNDRVIHWDDATFEGWPVWSLDSKRIVFQRAFQVGDEHLSFGNPFAIANADGTGKALEISPRLGGNGAHAEFSPDGTKVLMRTQDAGTQLILDPNGGPWVTVPWASWSYPNWQRLAP